MYKVIKYIFRDIGEANFFLKLLFITYIFLIGFGTEKTDLYYIINQIIIWGMIPLLFLIAFAKNKLFKKNYLPPEYICYFLFIVLALANYTQVTSDEAFAPVLRRVVMTFVMFLVADYAVKSNKKAIHIIFLSVMVGSLILCIHNYKLIGSNEVGFAASSERADLISIDDASASINVNGLSFIAVNGIMGIMFLLRYYKESRALLLTCLPIPLIIIVAAASKSGFINLISFISLWYIFCISGNSRNKAIYISILIIAVLVLYIFIDDLLKGTYLLARFEEIDKNYYNENNRGRLIQQGLEIFMENPLFGVGLGQLSNYTGVYSHNDIVEVLSNTGIAGGLFYFPMYFFLYQRIQRLIKRVALTEDETYNVKFCQAVLFTLLIRGISLPLFEQFDEMYMFGLLVSYTFFLEKKKYRPLNAI